MKAFEDPNHEGNSKKYHTKKLCIERGCPNMAETAWNPYWCFKHNVERMRKITEELNKLASSFDNK